ncbi:hypothetical protein [Shewanella sp.]|uniref:hypothetical protein n=1 Tax=Shewanella sp. TaxID=50422 RepID=UPI0035646F1A
MLSRALYEPLPHACMLAASATLIWHQSILSLSAGLLLFFMGARIYILRSANRRTDPARKRKNGRLPQFLYELFPFACLAFSMLLLSMNGTGWQIVPSLMLISYGLYVLASRTNYRKHQRPVQ